MRSCKQMKTLIIFLCVTLFFSSCSNENSHELKTDNQTLQEIKKLNANGESVSLMFEAIKAQTQKYSENSKWRYVIKKKDKWEFDKSINESISIDISTEPQISIIFRMDDVTLISNVKDYLSKGDTLIFNTSNIHYENQTFMFFPIDKPNKIVQWATFDDNKIQPFGNFMNDTLTSN